MICIGGLFGEDSLGRTDRLWCEFCRRRSARCVLCRQDVEKIFLRSGVYMCFLSQNILEYALKIEAMLWKTRRYVILVALLR